MPLLGACHASHEACELKCQAAVRLYLIEGHASHEACELKLSSDMSALNFVVRHASHEACELKSSKYSVAFSANQSRLA